MVYGMNTGSEVLENKDKILNGCEGRVCSRTRATDWNGGGKRVFRNILLQNLIFVRNLNLKKEQVRGKIQMINVVIYHFLMKYPYFFKVYFDFKNLIFI